MAGPYTTELDNLRNVTAGDLNTDKLNVNVVSSSAGGATEATLAKLPLTQGSTTSGESGVLVQGAVTTSAPSYTNGQTDPISLTPAGALRTDSSAVTQPISAASLPLPTGASTDSSLSTINANITNGNLRGTLTPNSDRVGSGTITGAGQSVTVSTIGCTTANFIVSGTWVATFLVLGTINGAGVTVVQCYPTLTGIPNGGIFNANGSFSVPCAGFDTISIAAFAYTSGTTTVNYEATTGCHNFPVYNDITTPLFISGTDGQKSTYSASITVVPAVAATDIFTISGSSTKTIRVTHLELSITATVSTTLTVSLIKRSTANSAGTSSAAIKVPHDSVNAASSSTVLGYTANPTLGTSVGAVRTDKIVADTSGVANSGLTYDFGTRNGQAVVLKGTAQHLVVNLNGTSITGGSASIDIEWTEE